MLLISLVVVVRRQTSAVCLFKVRLLDHGMEAVALFSYTASEVGEISLKKGDVIKVLDMEDDPHWFTAEIQGKRGYVPENYISLLPHTWFAGRVTRQDTEQRLRWQPQGAFLVRESESAPGEFSLSVSYGDMVEHFRVLEGAGQYCIWEESFCSLNRLVDYYRSHSIAVERAVYLRDLQSNAPQPLPESSRNPYPNPYKNSPHRLHSRASPPEREASSRPSEPALGMPQMAQALYDYKPPHAAHLHFLRGDIIDLLDCSGLAHWTGRCHGRVGLFPPGYVQPLHH
ncbi:GRB2-related adapter protein-like isoform X1 [Gadus chalcogrammus]|uniref:GRB2-related adapter protein-like isoform X1 n=1 Tax=Gadus chalcogrammus TaxID=1042646 RepID=UPI0024C2EEB8|nr:GRB2-related adapter protein-like isoform X1 [Gadus chalcogrammus]